MPTRNRPELIGRAVNAILSQDHSDLEILIGDGSDSPVFDILPTDSRIKYWYRPNDTDRLNFITTEASGEVLNFQADDDIMMAGTLSLMLSLMPEPIAWAYGHVEAGGRDYGGSWDLGRLGMQNYIPCPGVFWKRWTGQKIGRWDMSVQRAADWDYWLRLGHRWVPAYTSRQLVHYTLHVGQDSSVNHGAMMADTEVVRGRYRAGYYRCSD